MITKIRNTIEIAENYLRDKKPATLFILIVLPVFLVLTIALTWRHLASSPNSMAHQVERKVQALKIKKQATRERVEALGQIEFFEKAQVTSRVTGRIERILVREGDRVKKGQLLVKLERLPLELELKKQEAALSAADSEVFLAREQYRDAQIQARSRLKSIEKQEAEVGRILAETELNRVSFNGKQILHEKGGVSPFELQRVEAELKAAESRLLGAKKDLEIMKIGYTRKDLSNAGIKIPKETRELEQQLILLNSRSQEAALNVSLARKKESTSSLESTRILLSETKIYSPLDGIVVSRTKSPGEEVSQGASGDPILTIIDASQVFAVFRIRESSLGSIREGMDVVLTTDSIKKKEFTAKISAIVPVIDPESHTASARALLPNPLRLLRHGMVIRGVIHTGENEELILIPEGSILPGNGEIREVFVLRKKRAYRKKIKTSRTFADQMIEVTSGLEPGDIIIKEKPSSIVEGMKVFPVFPETQEPDD